MTKKPKLVKRVAVLFNDGSMNVHGKKRLQGRSPLETAVDECGDANENVRLKSQRARVVYITVDEASITDVFP